MTDYNEVYRRNDYKATQSEVRELLTQISEAVTEHEKRAKDWPANQTLLSAKCSLHLVLDSLKPAGGAMKGDEIIFGGGHVRRNLAECKAFADGYKYNRV